MNVMPDGSAMQSCLTVRASVSGLDFACRVVRGLWWLRCGCDVLRFV